MNQFTSSYLFALVCILIGLRGGHGLWSFFQGMGCEFYYLPWFNKKYYDEKRLQGHNWFVRYSAWRSNVMWVWVKKNPSNFEKYYLLYGSLMQVFIGILGIILLIMKLSYNSRIF